MNFKINLDWKICLTKFKSIDYSECYFNFLGQKSRWLIFLALIFVVGSCGYIWYEYVYNPGWSGEQKETYINSKEKGTIFNKVKFKEIIADQEKRKEKYDGIEEGVNDIFRLGEREIE